jgi:hypothetical protein
VLLRTTSNGFCPLLKYDIKDGGKFKCIIHAAKPGACSNHPIGVAYSINKETNESNTQYIKVQQCENSVSDEMHTVREWVAPYTANEKEIEAAHKIQHLVTDYFNPRKFWLLSMVLKELSANSSIPESEHDEFVEMSSEMLKLYIATSINLGYVSYDIDKPFIEQAERNMEELRDFYVKTKELIIDCNNCLKEITAKMEEGESKDSFIEALKELEVE